MHRKQFKTKKKKKKTVLRPVYIILRYVYIHYTILKFKNLSEMFVILNPNLKLNKTSMHYVNEVSDILKCFCELLSFISFIQKARELN